MKRYLIFKGLVIFLLAALFMLLWQGKNEVPVDDSTATVERPQEPVAPFPYQEEEVRIAVDDEVTLAGTLTIPPGDGPFAAVLLITGAGAQDRDEMVFAHKPFLVLADYLTRRGLVVLRLDDRGVGGSTGSFTAASAEEMVGDVVRAVQWLEDRPEVKSVGLLGHSEGGAIGPLAALQTEKQVQFLVLLAAPGLPFYEILCQQDEVMAAAEGVSREDRDRHQALQRQLFEIIKTEGDTPEARARAREVMRESVAEFTAEEREALGATEQAMEDQITTMFSNLLRRFLAHDPATVLRKIQVPVLALNGEMDLQVAAAENLGAIEAALVEAGNEDFQTEVLPGLNHLFQNCVTGLPSEYAEIRETFDERTLERIGDWVLEKSRK